MGTPAPAAGWVAGWAVGRCMETCLPEFCCATHSENCGRCAMRLIESHCRGCMEPIGQGEWRVGMQATAEPGRV